MHPINIDNNLDSLLARIDNLLSSNLGSLSGLQKRALRSGVRTALGHAQKITQTLAPPLDVGQHLWLGRKLVPIFFASADQGVKTIRESQALYQYFQDPLAQQAYFLLTMYRHEFKTLGHELDGEIVQREVLQTVVEMIDHRIDLVAGSVAELLKEIQDQIVLYLAGLVPQAKSQSKVTQQSMTAQQKLIQAQVRTLELAHQADQPLTGSENLQDKLNQGQAILQDLNNELQTLENHGTTQDYVQQIIQVLNQPQDHVRFERITEYLHDFGIKSSQGQAIEFQDCIYDRKKHRSVLILSLERSTAQKIWPDL